MQIVEIICMTGQILFSRKKLEKYSKMLSAEILTSMQSVSTRVTYPEFIQKFCLVHMTCLCNM